MLRIRDVVRWKEPLCLRRKKFFLFDRKEVLETVLALTLNGLDELKLVIFCKNLKVYLFSYSVLKPARKTFFNVYPSNAFSSPIHIRKSLQENHGKSRMGTLLFWS